MKRILIIGGDGIGPEITKVAQQVLEQAATACGIALQLDHADLGGVAIERYGEPLPDDTLTLAKQADAILFGAVGGPQWDSLPFEQKPERGLLRLRAALSLYANLRPATVSDELVAASTLKAEVVRGVDLLVIRELTGGIYFGSPRGAVDTAFGPGARNTMVYSRHEIERIVRLGFETARQRRGKLCSVDKANVLEVSVLWREIATQLAKEYADVEFSSLYVDNAAMQLLREPRQFDTIVTGNLFGDILSDEAAMLTGSIGMLPSASLGGEAGGECGLYEPVHGSAPDLAGRDLANPLAAILSVGMLFQHALGQPAVAGCIAASVHDTLKQARTGDIMAAGKQQVGCQEMGDRVLNNLEAQLAALVPQAPTAAVGT